MSGDSAPDQPIGFGIGQPVRRTEDRRLVSGAGRYVDDIVLPNQAFAAILMSSHAHARLRHIDTTKARSAPGVLCVLTGQDIQDAGLGAFPPLFMPEHFGGPKGYATARPLLCADRVMHVGDRVAFVVAETSAQARNALDLIEVTYEPLESVIAIDDAVAEGAPVLWPDCPTGNVSLALHFGDKEATDRAFAGAAMTVALRLENNRLSPNPLEPRCAIGQYDAADDAYTLYATSQNPHGARQMICQSILHIPETRLRVVSPDVGGGFGMKADPFPEDALVLWAARVCGRPVKYLASRSDSLLGDTHGRDQIVDAAMATDGAGKILGIRAHALHGVGAYIVSAGMGPPIFALRFIPGAYDVQAVDLSSRVVFTNTGPIGVYRGAGRPEATYVVERLLDEAAVRLGIDPAEIRRRNFIRPDQLPYHTPTHFNYDSGEFELVTDACLKAADWQGFAARRRLSSDKGLLRGHAVTYYIEQGGVFNDRMGLQFDPGGGVTIVAGTHSHGQGHATVFAQMVAEWLHIPFDKVAFRQGDTAIVPFGRGTYAARSSMIGGNALKIAADRAIEQGSAMAAHLLAVPIEQITFEAGLFKTTGSNRTLSMTEVIRAFYRPGGIPASLGVGLDTVGSWSADAPNFPNGCHICEVEVEPETGVVRIERYTVVDDVGRALNPMICKGQVTGGIMQGIGQALLEHVVYDRESGQLLTGSFTDYCMPRADDMPPLAIGFHDVPCTTNPLGIKGVGESGAIAAPPTIMNAIIDALRPLGVEHIDMPATPSRVWHAIRAAAL